MKSISIALAIAASVVCSGRAAADELEDKPIDRWAVVRAVLARHPEVRAADAEARSVRASVAAEGTLPPPEAMAQVWQIPLEKPYAVNEAGMVMFGVTQRFPSPGALGLREEARRSEADAADLMTRDKARLVARDAGHAFVAYAEARARHDLHAGHEHIERRIAEIAHARHATGGSLAEAVRADAEVARTSADVASEAISERTAQSELNVLLGRPLDGRLGTPAAGEPRVPTEGVDVLVARAVANRPEPQAAARMRAARESDVRAARTEANVPSFALSGLYFPKVGPAMSHAYGVSAAVELPWLWGGAKERLTREEARAAAAAASATASAQPIAVEVVAARAATMRAAERLRVLTASALPAGKRAVDVEAAGYESGGTSLQAVLEARRNLVDIEMAVVDARAALDHALVDLEAAVGGPVATQALFSSSAPSAEVRHEH
ncbi:MAG: TolC family protein [Polyangiaceae bacterium]